MIRKVITLSVIALLVLSFLTGCRTNQVEIQKNFNKMIEKSATQDRINDAEDYVNKFISKLDKENASLMLVDFEGYVLGFNTNGIDYSQWIEKYGKKIDPALVELYEFKVREQEAPMAKEATLKIGWGDIANRALELENYIADNKNNELVKEDADWMYENYINTMVMGTNGTPIFDYKTSEFSNNARNAYAAFINKYPDSTVSWVLREYFSYLNSINYTLDYNDKVSSKSFFDTCNWLVSESGKRVFQ